MINFLSNCHSRRSASFICIGRLPKASTTRWKCNNKLSLQIMTFSQSVGKGNVTTRIWKNLLMCQPLSDTSHINVTKNVTTKCHYKLPQQIVTTNQKKISCISFIYFPHGIVCKGTWNAVYLVLIKVATLLSHFCCQQRRKMWQQS